MTYDAKYLRGLSDEELEGTISERDEALAAVTRERDELKAQLEEANQKWAEHLGEGTCTPAETQRCIDELNAHHAEEVHALLVRIAELEAGK